MNKHSSVVAASLALLFGALALAGPLAPPAGPVAATNKTLSDIEPRIAINATNTPGNASATHVISQPGSYYLTGNIAGEVSKDGIRIAASDVTIDLNGFSLAGLAGSNNGIIALNSVERITIRNGSVTGWGGAGIDLASATRACLIENVHSAANASFGIRACTSGIVRSCTVTGNVGTGIILFNRGIAQDCVADQNANGFATSGPALFTGCIARSNGVGFSTNQDCIVRHCIANNNTGVGISAGVRSLVEDCSLTGNDGEGMVVSIGSVIRNNLIDQVGAATAALHVAGADCRIEDNTCSRGSRGILVTASGCIIVRNACNANTIDWDIAVNNLYGPIIDRRSPSSSGISGFASAGSIGSSDPNANYSY